MSMNTSTHLQQLQKAVQLHQSGQLVAAEAIYRGVLREDPKQPDALHYLGMLLNQTGDPLGAIEYINASILVSPKNAIYFSNLGTIYTGLRDFESAAAAFRKSIALSPTFTTAIVNLGCTLKDLKQYPEAMQTFKNAIAQNPKLPDAFNHLGEVQTLLGMHDDADRSFLLALQVSPQHTAAMINYSSSLIRKRQFERSATICRQAILINPGAWGPFVNLGINLMELKQYRDARENFTNALSIVNVESAPETANLIHTNLGMVAMGENNLDEAIGEFNRAIELDSSNFQTHAALAFALKAVGKLPDAIECLRKSITLKPDDAVTRSNYLLTLLYSPDYSREFIFAEHKNYSDQFERPFESSILPFDNKKNPARKLRIGYVSGDLRDHVVSFYFEPILLNHDRSRVDVVCFSNTHSFDPTSTRLKALTNNWIMCKDMTDIALYDRIRKEKIDILIDLSGHTGDNRLPVFARRAAPVQMTWLGYAGTTGLSNIDYRISDEHLDPVGVTDDIHSEVVIRLPSSQAVFKPDPKSPDVNLLPCLSSPNFMFACLNGIYKINSEVAQLWAEILRAVPNSLLMLGNANDSSATRGVEAMLVKAGIDQARLVFKPRMAQIDYLQLHHDIDLALDTFPYCGATTTCHSIWMGVPVVTLAGNTTVSRCGVATLEPIGLDEYIATSKAQYVQIAAAIASDKDKLAKTRSQLRNRIRDSSKKNPLMVTRDLERLYRAAWGAWCNGRKLSGDFVLPQDHLNK